jgi:Fic family protein
MISNVPSFEADEVALLVSAVRKSLEQLRQANERVGANDTELIEYGRRYAVLLQKLEAVASR